MAGWGEAVESFKDWDGLGPPHLSLAMLETYVTGPNYPSTLPCACVLHAIDSWHSCQVQNVCQLGSIIYTLWNYINSPTLLSLPLDVELLSFVPKQKVT